MVDQIITTDTTAMESQQVAMKTTDDCGQIAGVLYGIPIGSGLLLNGIGTHAGRFYSEWKLKPRGVNLLADLAVFYV